LSRSFTREGGKSQGGVGRKNLRGITYGKLKKTINEESGIAKKNEEASDR